jgi:Cu(I)/Ag(I) efflux system membrane fusion protein
LLKPGLYGGALLAAIEDKPDRLAVPDSAVLDSGARQVVLVQKAEGRFEPHVVKLGDQADGYWEVLDGLQAGDKVVTHANFLIDAESNFKAALEGFDNHGGEAGQAKPEMQHEDH